MDKQVYARFDLGSGLHISLDPEHYEALIPNGFVVGTSLGKIKPPKDKVDEVWDMKWEYLKTRADLIVSQLNQGLMTPDQASAEIEQINKDTNNNEITI